MLVIDVNERPPRFEKSVYDVKIRENSKIGTLVGSIKANDPDNNKIEYAILNNHESPFVVNKHDGSIKVNGRLDYEMKPKYTLDVVAKDGNFSDNAIVNIDLINMVDKAPYFEYNYYDFKIKIPSDIYIGQVRAIDVEKGNNLKYSLRVSEANESNLFCISQNGIIYICPSKKSNDSSFGITDDELLSKFKRNEYKFNVTASIYSRDLLSSLENSVECRIEVFLNDLEISRETKNSSTYLFGSLPFSPPTYLNEMFFKDPNNIYIIVGTFIGIVILLIFCVSFALWIKCSSKKNKRHSNHIYRNYTTHCPKPSLPPLDYFSKTNYCSSNCSECNSCVNSTTSCTITESKSPSNSKVEMRHGDDSNDDSSPVSKITIISDYLDNESNMNKMLKGTDFDKIRVSAYSNILSSTASTLKNREMPILVRQENVYDVDNYESGENGPTEYFQIMQTGSESDNSTLKTTRSYCIPVKKNGGKKSYLIC